MTEFLMPLRSLFEAVSEFPSSIALRESQFMWPWVIVFHVVTMAIFAGLVVMMDFRLLGWGNVRTPFSEVQRRLFPWQMGAMALTSVTGSTLLYADPMRFYVNIFFWIKILMMVVTAINALAFHFITYKSIGIWDSAETTPLGARLSGLVSVVLWALVIVSGRLIPYNWFQ